MSRPRLLDLYCCAGGAARGYHAAGFDVVGVDIIARPNFPFEFVRGDAIAYAREHARKFDLVHASPPCQGYSSHVTSASSIWTPTLGKDEPRLIAATRAVLVEAGMPYVLENVMGARRDQHANLMLCGSMFGLPIARHRLFECSFWVPQPEHPNCQGIAKRYAEARGWEYRDMSCTGKGRRKGTAERWKEILGLTGATMTQQEIAESIPPAFTRYIGERFLASNPS